ncbi:MAG: 3-phosphoshikimate 1-carboxyvinyltransferase [Sedimentibacter sp.]
MESIKIKPSKLKGEVVVPPSKSLSHRAIICSSLCNDGVSIINNITLSQDIQATIEGMNLLGAEIKISENQLYIKRSNKIEKHPVIDCRESGSSLRFLIPVSLVLTDNCTFTGSKKLFERPLDVYYDIFNKQSIDYKINGCILAIKGVLSPDNFEIAGNLSSQFISGLLFSLPLLDRDSVITVIGSFESKTYVDLTIEVLNKFGILIEMKDEKTYYIPGKQQYKSCEYTVEGDYSQAAFFLVANELGNEVECLGLNNDSLQGDKEIINIINKFKEDLHEITIDASQIPDLVPIIAVLAAIKEYCTTTIINAHRLRTKESDRLKSITTEMNKLGAHIAETVDGLVIHGKNTLNGGTRVNSWNDHRIAMALAVAATKCKHDIVLENHMAVLKSYPHFWEDYNKLGGSTIELNDRQ